MITDLVYNQKWTTHLTHHKKSSAWERHTGLYNIDAIRWAFRNDGARGLAYREPIGVSITELAADPQAIRFWFSSARRKPEIQTDEQQEGRETEVLRSTLIKKQTCIPSIHRRRMTDGVQGEQRPTYTRESTNDTRRYGSSELIDHK